MDNIETSRVNLVDWPKNVRQIDLADIDNFGIDDQKRLYWRGEMISAQRMLTLRHKTFIALVAGAVAIGALGEAVKGALAYNNWACHVRPNWPSICSQPRTLKP